MFLLTIAAGVRGERLPVKTYTTADGLPRDTVTRIRQDSRGFMWFCTGEGLSRFDGVGMMNFTVADGLPHRIANDFLETKDGQIYVATNHGLARLNPQGVRGAAENPLFTAFLPENPKAEKIQTLYEDKSGRIWVGTSDGLYRFSENDGRAIFELVPLGKPLPGFGGAIAEPDPTTIYINTLIEDRQGVLWIGTFGSGLFRLEADGNLRRYTASGGLGDNKITDLLEARNGQIWLSKRSDDTGGICLLNAENILQPIEKCYTTADGLGSNWVRDMFQTGDGQIWLATVPGLCRWQENAKTVCKTYTEKNDLCDDSFTLAEDREGNLWIGSSCGVKKIARYGFSTYDAADGLESSHVNAMFENSNGELFGVAFPKNGRFISRFDGEKFSTVKANLPASVNYHGWGWHQTVWQDSAGAWWIPTGTGLFRSPDRTNFEELAAAPLEKQKIGSGDFEIFRLFEDSRGDIWIATTQYRNELWRWERARNVWHDYTAQAEFSESRVGTAFSEDRHGNIWIGTSSDHGDNALIRFRNGEFRVFSREDGISTGWIMDLFADRNARLWIATTESGLLRLDDTNSERLELIKYTPENGLTSAATTCVTEDEFGRIYVGTWRGIDRLDPNSGQIENFSNADGLPGGYIEASYRDRRNNLWFMTEKGLVRFKPEPVRPRNLPNILITGLRVNGLPQQVSILGETALPPLALNSDEKQISVDFIRLGGASGDKLIYEYRLNDENWTATNERTVNFANLADGNYRFEVRAQTADGIFSRTAFFSFKIAPPFWLHWWFLSAVAVLIGLTVYLIYQNRLRRMIEIERTRTRIATDLHDDIGSNLTKISIMSEVAQRIEGTRQTEVLHSIADISRSSVASMSDIVWAINPKKDSLRELLRRMRSFAEEIFEQKEIKLEFNAPEIFGDINLDADTRRNIFLIFKESVNNIVRHSQAEKARISLEIIYGKLVLTIADNGNGFALENEIAGNGLLNIKRRAADLNGVLEITSKPESGTEIVLKIRI